MTNEEEKILEEILDEGNDITLEDAAAEEAEELQEEIQDEVKEVREEIPDDVRLDPDEIRERPVLRGGLRGAADPNMIQKHIDNFLAMLCGETPVDSNVRTSAEYWLKRLATGEGAGSTKKIYCHTVRFVRSGSDFIAVGTFIVFTNSPDAFTTNDFKTLIKTPDTVFPVFSGYHNSPDLSICRQVLDLRYKDGEGFIYDYYDIPVDKDTAIGSPVAASPSNLDGFTITELGVYPIN